MYERQLAEQLQIECSNHPARERLEREQNLHKQSEHSLRFDELDKRTIYGLSCKF